MIKILWLSPSFNHYKARFLNHLGKEKDIELTILSGMGRTQMGDQELDGNWTFKHIKIDVSKKDFGKSKIVRKELKTIFNEYDWVLIPAEKKNLPLFLYALYLRLLHKKTKLFSYNHPILKSKGNQSSLFDRLLTKFYYKKLDRVVFYTEKSHQWAISNKFIRFEKAFWANNTIDNTEVNKNYGFRVPPKDVQSLLFIGRLIPSKRIADAIHYFSLLKEQHKNLKLEIIGDGPDRAIVEDAIKKEKDITWHGTLVNEVDIAPIMARSSFVFIPGLSGLSINHAFAYGRPYITLKAVKHGPEISYLKNDINGLLLNDKSEEILKAISDLLNDKVKLDQLCINAKAKAEELTVEKWVQQIKNSLIDE